MASVPNRACLVLVTLLMFVVRYKVEGLTCLQCDGVPQPRLCSKVVDCYDGEVCDNFTSIDTSCSECCETSLCNADLCGQPGYPQSRGPICFNCPVHTTSGPCHNIDFCLEDEACNIVGRQLFSDEVFTSKCVSKHACKENAENHVSIIGKRDIAKRTQQHTCDLCCTHDLCNRNCSTTTSVFDGNDCIPGLCGPHGVCVDGVNSYTCSCHSGFTGPHCLSNIDDCTTQPCDSDGTCNDVDNGYTCICALGYSGQKCEIDIDDCIPGLCGSGGTCVDGVNSYSCLCRSGFTGPNCQTNIDDCTTQPCGFDGTCYDGDNGYTCVCALGYSGQNCKIDIDDCTTQPCGSDGTCYDGDNGYTCICALGYSGQNCEIDIDDCIPGLCGSGGTCVDGINSYSCLCRSGFTGPNCQTNVDDCTPQPCGSTGTCYDSDNEYTCICALGYSGKNCEIDIDDCISGLCGFNGTCIDGVNSYTCSCHSGFTGLKCDTSNYTDCYDVLTQGKITQDGVYNVTTWKTHQQIEVLCDMTTAGGGWTVFQNRYDGSIDFYRPFAEYENGFGDLKTEFWLGLKYIQEMTNQRTNELRIDLKAADDSRAYETFSSFSLTDGTKYRLDLGPSSSSLNISDDSIRQYHNGQAFSTYDRDLDKSSGNCADTWHGAWWYSDCHKSNLNGKYLTPGSKGRWEGIDYDSFSSGESLKTSKMMFRRVK